MTLARSTLALATVLAATACTTGDPTPPAAAAPSHRTRPAPSARGGVVVAELFTSQGCSSCPPADRLLARIAAGELADRPVIALAYHVDYWDDLGWTDRFSSAANTRRQSDYADALAGGRLYTPQLVVDGRAHVVGSRERAVRAALADAPAVASLSARAERRGDRLVVHAEPPSGTRTVVAVYQDDLVTRIAAGENRGATLHHDRVVRALAPLVDGTATITLDPSWPAASLGAVVLAHDADRAVVAADQLAW